MPPAYERAMERYHRAKSDCDRTQEEIEGLLERPAYRSLRDLAIVEGLRLERNKAFEELRLAEEAAVEAALQERRQREGKQIA